MIPDSYKPKKTLPLEAKLDQVINAVADMKALNEVQFAHVDANIGHLKDYQETAIDRLREDQRAAQEGIIMVVRELLETHIRGLKETQERQNERLDDNHKRFSELHDHVNSKLTYMDSKIDKHLLLVQSVEGRVDELEHAPDKKAAGWWRTVAGLGIAAFAGAFLTTSLEWIESFFHGVSK